LKQTNLCSGFDSDLEELLAFLSLITHRAAGSLQIPAFQD